MKMIGDINIKLIASACTVNLLSFSNGNAFSWSSTVLTSLKSNDTLINPIGRPITLTEESLIASLVSLGGICCPTMAGFLSKKIGRKRTLLMFAVPMLFAHLILAFATRPAQFYVARFMLGLGTGSSFTVLPMYLGEIAETRIRGLLGCLLGVFLAFGILFTYCVGPFVSIRTFSFMLTAPLVIFLFIFGLFVPESPYFYLTKGNEKEAERSLTKLRKNDPCANLKELALMKETVEESLKSGSSLCELLNSRSFKKGLTITVSLMIIQQCIGTTIIFSYMEGIFNASGSAFSSSHSTIVVAGIQTVVIIFSSSVVDKWGRKLLLVISSGGCSVSLFVLGLYFYLKDRGMDMSPLWLLPISTVIVFTVSFKLGLSALPWTLLGELFSSHSKSTAATITTTVVASLAFTTTLIFPSMKEIIGFHGSFWFFSVNALMGLIFSLYYIPETKGKTFQEIQRLLER